MRLAWRSVSRFPASMGDVARNMGMTEGGFAKHLLDRLSKDDVMDVLKVGTQALLAEWVSERGLEATGGRFVVALRLSRGRRHDAALFCICRVDMSGDLAMIRCDRAVPAVMGAEPSMIEGLERFDAGLNDLETEVVDERKG